MTTYKVPAWRRDILALRLEAIRMIIEKVDARCAAVDGPCPTTKEMLTTEELCEIYGLAGGYKQPNPNWVDSPSGKK
jgi:hypothetical protein